MSSAGIGRLNKILNNLSRTDLLDFGDGRKIKKMQVARWDVIAIRSIIAVLFLVFNIFH